ncbi:MAG: hypothetical protein GWP09_00030 [Nitrospiraceae bacterium]|nr:hypothetical protein [Nitrospiraceae bacterium]
MSENSRHSLFEVIKSFVKAIFVFIWFLLSFPFISPVSVITAVSLNFGSPTCAFTVTS